MTTSATRRSYAPALRSVFAKSFTSWNKHQSSTSLVDFNSKDAIEALNLFRLPELSLRGVRRADFVTLERLNPDDLERCLKAQRELVTSKIRIALHLFRGDHDGIAKVRNQTNNYKCLVEEIHRRDMMCFYTKPEARPDVLSPYFGDYLGAPKTPNCETCAGIARDYERGERIAAWKRLPKYAGIGGGHCKVVD